MIKFKQFVVEMTQQEIQKAGYSDPFPRAKFQKNDWVVIKGSEYRWLGAQSKRSTKYIGQYGKIVGYKPGSQQVKYAVQFPMDNNNIEVFHSHFIEGPYNSVESAKSAALKKFDPNLTTPFAYKPKIQSNMMRGYTTAELQSRPEVEAKLIEMFSQAPFNLTVPGKPVKFEDGKYVATILAYRPITGALATKKISDYHMDIKIQSSQLKKFMSKNICLIRLNNAVSKKLADLTSSTTKLSDGDGRASSLIWSNSPYALNMPEIDIQRLAYGNARGGNVIYFLDKEKFQDQIFNDPYDRVLNNNVYSVPTVLIKRPELINQLVEAYNKVNSLAEGNYDPQKMFNDYYNIEIEGGKKVAHAHIIANEETLHYFNDVYLEYHPPSPTSQFRHNMRFTVSTRNLEKCKIPPQFMDVVITTPRESYVGKISGKAPVQVKDLHVLSKNVRALTLENCKIESFDGIPDPLDFLTINSCEIESGTLEGIPKIINASFELSRNKLKTLKGGENTVVGQIVDIYDEQDLESIEGIPESKNNIYRLPRDFSQEQVEKIVNTRKFTKSLKPKTQKSFADIFKGLN